MDLGWIVTVKTTFDPLIEHFSTKEEATALYEELLEEGISVHVVSLSKVIR
jgi:hypothetical protein